MDKIKDKILLFFFLIFLFCLVSSSFAQITFTGDTNKPQTSTFAIGDKVILTFDIKGIKENNLNLKLNIVDALNKTIKKVEIPIKPDKKGNCKISYNAPTQKLGFYRVYAEISNGIELPALGSRPEGFLTYCIVPNPAKRILYPENETFFGMQGGFVQAINIMSYLGIRWVLGGFGWSQEEPNGPGEFTKKITETKGNFNTLELWKNAKIKIPGTKTNWKVYAMPSLYMAPKWAVIPGTFAGCTGALTPQGETYWKKYCSEVAATYKKIYPDEKRIYQITWEPVYPWGYKGTDKELIQIYKIAYSAIHQADSNALVIGPTEDQIKIDNEQRNLFKEGLGKYIDAFSIHPYIAYPPEKNNLVQDIKQWKEFLYYETGKHLPMYGTESGGQSGYTTSGELSQATGDIRENLILKGEGFKANLSFYVVDFPPAGNNNNTYGYYYDLTPGVSWNSSKIGPKPAAPAYAAMTYLLEGTKSLGPINWLGNNSLGYVFENYLTKKITLALWNYGNKPKIISLPVGVKEIKVYDWMGNEKNVITKNGLLKVTLTQEPIYITDVSSKIWGKNAKKPIQLNTSSIITFPGKKINISGKVLGINKSFTGKVIIKSKELGINIEKDINVSKNIEKPFNVSLKIPERTSNGTYTVEADLINNQGNLVGLTGLRVLVESLINIEYVKPFFKGSQKGLSIAIQEEQNEPFKGNIEVRIKGIPNSNKQTEVFILPQQEKIININYSDIDVNPVFSYKTAIKIISNNGYQIKKNFLVNFLQAPKFKSPPFLTGNLSSWKNIPAITLKGKQWVVRGAPYYTGPQQTWGNLRYGWDEKYLYFACEVYYDVFSQPYTGYNTWAADSLQLAFNLDPYKKQQKTGNAVADTNSIKRYSEIDFALTKQGPQTCRTISFNPDKFPIGLISPDILKFTAKKENLKNGQTKVIYEAAIPWKLLGMQNPPKAGQVIGIAATMNYLSKQKKLIAIGIFKGIADSKNPDEFGLLYLGGTE